MVLVNGKASGTGNWQLGCHLSIWKPDFISLLWLKISYKSKKTVTLAGFLMLLLRWGWIMDGFLLGRLGDGADCGSGNRKNQAHVGVLSPPGWPRHALPMGTHLSKSHITCASSSAVILLWRWLFVVFLFSVKSSILELCKIKAHSKVMRKKDRLLLNFLALPICALGVQLLIFPYRFPLWGGRLSSALRLWEIFINKMLQNTVSSFSMWCMQMLA